MFLWGKIDLYYGKSICSKIGVKIAKFCKRFLYILECFVEEALLNKYARKKELCLGSLFSLCHFENFSFFKILELKVDSACMYKILSFSLYIVWFGLSSRCLLNLAKREQNYVIVILFPQNYLLPTANTFWIFTDVTRMWYRPQGI